MPIFVFGYFVLFSFFLFLLIYCKNSIFMSRRKLLILKFKYFFKYKHMNSIESMWFMWTNKYEFKEHSWEWKKKKKRTSFILS